MSIIFNQSLPKEEDEYFIGIDQSMTHTGLTVLKGDQIIFSKGFSSSNDLTFEERISSIRSFIVNTLNKYDKEKVFISIEGLAFNRKPNNNSMMLFGLFTMIITEFTTLGYRYKIVPPKTLKKFATGNGNADKDVLLEKIENEDKIKLFELSNVKNKKKFEDIVDSFWLSMYSKALFQEL